MKNNKKNKTIILIIFSILTIILFSSIAYSAFETTMNIKGKAFARVETNVRITNFSLFSSTNNASSSYEEYSKNTISSGLKLPSNGTLTYEVEVTNYGTSYVAISNITGLPSNLTYNLTNYNLKDKICDDSNKCNSFAKKVFNITIKNTTSSTIETEATLTFEFQVFHTITYTNIPNNNYQSEILNGETLQVNLSSNPPLIIGTRSGETILSHTYENNIITISNITNNVEIEGAYTIEFSYDYTGDYQTFQVPHRGIYKVELWGAQGGNYSEIEKPGACGGYVSGNIQLQKNKYMYVYVGENNDYMSGDCYTSNPNNSFNAHMYGGCASGGGATDIRLSTSTHWYDFLSLKSRIIVAAGGAPSYYTKGGEAGGLWGYLGEGVSDYIEYPFIGSNGTQTGVLFGRTDNSGTTLGGGGYYAGGVGFAADASGGSSFISGHNGCDAIAESSTEYNIIHTNQSVHYSGYKFSDTLMIDGLGYKWTNTKGSYTGMPTHDGTSIMTGNTGNGYAKITLLEIN